MARGSFQKWNDWWASRVDAGVNAETDKRRQMLRQGFKTKREVEKALLRRSSRLNSVRSLPSPR